MSLSGKYIRLSSKDSGAAAPDPMSDAALIRRLYGPNAAKLLARDNDVSPSAAKKWLQAGLPDARVGSVLAQARQLLQRRLDELAELEAELDRIDRVYRALAARRPGRW